MQTLTESRHFAITVPVVVSDDVCLDAQDAGVSLPDPGQAVGPQLLHVAREVNSLTQGCRNIQNWRQTKTSKVWSSVEPCVLACGEMSLFFQFVDRLNN